MKLKDLCSYLDSVVPLSFQEGYDNSGLQVGQPDKAVSSALISLDVTDEIIDEAINEGCDIIISHHPVIFGGIKKISDSSFSGRIIFRAIKNDIAIYSAHTNLDVVNNGVSMKMARKAGLLNINVLVPLKNRLLKLVTYIPEDHFVKVSEAIFSAGAGVIGNYDNCGYSAAGTGSFRAGEGTNPFVGEKGSIHFEKEVRFETILFSHQKDKVVNALLAAHPYEVPAYDIYSLENDNINIGTGCLGELKEPLGERDFLEMISDVFDARGIRHTRMTGRNIKKVAVCGGAGSSLMGAAMAAGVDAFVTGDIKYHAYFEAADKILLVDCGHYESEKFSTEILYDLIIKKFPKFALRFSKVNTNPINYF